MPLPVITMACPVERVALDEKQSVIVGEVKTEVGVEDAVMVPVDEGNAPDNEDENEPSRKKRAGERRGIPTDTTLQKVAGDGNCLFSSLLAGGPASFIGWPCLDSGW